MSDSGQPGEDCYDPLLDNLNIGKVVEEVNSDHSLVHSQGELFDVVGSPPAEPLGGATLTSRHRSEQQDMAPPRAPMPGAAHNNPQFGNGIAILRGAWTVTC